MKTSYKILGVFAIGFLVSGVIDALYPALEQASFIIHNLFNALLLFSWCGAHTLENDIKPVTGAKLLSGIIGIIGVPYYLFKGFGFKEGSIKLLLGLGWLILSVALYGISTYAVSL